MKNRKCVLSKKAVFSESGKKLIFNEKIVSIIDKSIPNFVNNKLDKITDKMSSFYNEVKFPNYDDLEKVSI